MYASHLGNCLFRYSLFFVKDRAHLSSSLLYIPDSFSSIRTNTPPLPNIFKENMQKDTKKDLSGSSASLNLLLSLIED